MISLIHPSRGRPEKSANTIHKWINSAANIHSIELLVSCDMDDPMLYEYDSTYTTSIFRKNPIIANENESAVDAINYAAQQSQGEILIVVSDDTDCFSGWDAALLKEVDGKTDWILKTQDGIQPYIITMPIMDRAYYNRTGYIYHPDFQHLFCDTYLTCVADITGRKITSNLMFKHDHYSVNKTAPDELHKRNDATWKQGEETFIRLMKEFSPEERSRIQDPGMKRWLRNKGVR
jgi:hypothetical protein